MAPVDFADVGVCPAASFPLNTLSISGDFGVESSLCRLLDEEEDLQVNGFFNNIYFKTWVAPKAAT